LFFSGVAALRPGIAQRISELESRIEKTELGSDLDKLDQHLTGTVMH
jgi:hypothetical protein